MKDLHVETGRTASPIETSKLFSMLLIVLYTYYYLHMTILHVLLTSPGMMETVFEMIWLKRSMLVANFITLLFCVYCLIRNKPLANWWMDRMPAWMHRSMDRMPTWMYRWVNHNSMRIMMIAMDIMLIWMCVEFGLSTVNQFGW